MFFGVENFIETRSDNPNLSGYKVYLGNATYMMYYDRKLLREVYFLSGFPNYFMSSRTDMKTISHYYIDGNQIRRYENGVLNQIYTVFPPMYTICVKNGKEVVYKVNYGKKKFSKQKLYEDLTNFLHIFNEKEMYKLFAPQEPSE